MLDILKKYYFLKNHLDITIYFKLLIYLKLFYIALFLMIIIRLKLQISLKILICTVAKDENKYIKEFVEYYKNLKINKIIVYDNNDINGENFNNILKNEIVDNYVNIINYRGIGQPQTKAFDDCYKRYNKDFDWIAFFDVDEFLHIKNYYNINEFLSLPKFKSCQSILINWKYYGDNNKLYYEPKPVAERFTEPFYFSDKKIEYRYYYSAAKTIVRGGLNIIWQHFPHYLNNTIKCRADGKILDNYFSPPQYSIAYINHYLTKSTEEFAERLNRGDVVMKIDDNYIKSKINNYYFLFNKKTKEKVYLLQLKLKNKTKF